MAKTPRQPRGEMPLVQLLPNLVTLAAIGAGLTAMRLAVDGRFNSAVALILLAAIFDAMDGRLARALNSESAIGAELDSMADFLNFGAAPAFILHLWAQEHAGGPAWIAAIVYTICCVLRLARFNIGARAETGGDPRFFVGVPAPAGALLALMPLYVSRAFPDFAPVAAPLVGAHLLVVGALM